MQNSNKKGFTLLELLIVIGIIAILSVIVILILNPAETLMQSRDSQRMADLATLKTAVGLYMTTVTQHLIQLDGTSGTLNDKCLGGTTANRKIWITDAAVSDSIIGGGTTVPELVAGDSDFKAIGVSASTVTDGGGWLPVNLGAIDGGSPISALPIDPSNTAAHGTSTLAAVTNQALMYRYSCQKAPLAFEIDARLESARYGQGGTDDRGAKDGGDNPRLYEMGSRIDLLPGHATDYNSF